MLSTRFLLQFLPFVLSAAYSVRFKQLDICSSWQSVDSLTFRRNAITVSADVRKKTPLSKLTNIVWTLFLTSCTNLGDNGLNLLKTLDIIQSPKLNYLIINGAHLGDLPNSNIFGTNVHQHLHTIHLINAGITSFGPNTFSGAPELSFLVLDGKYTRKEERL